MNTKLQFSTVSYPLHSIDELLRFVPSGSVSSWSASRCHRYTSPRGPRIIHCHDMKGGYLEEDRDIMGSNNNQAYRFLYWCYVDTFIYFSHSCVTIPPICWVRAAHKHGVRILGTVITEWERGKKETAALVREEDGRFPAADQLVLIAKAYGFDGWFINFESDLSDLPAVATILPTFVRYLTGKVHAELGEEAQVIWYDSVIHDGRLRWQDHLNQNNCNFFHSCDGIFTNYTWKEQLPALSAQAAGQRVADVYTGTFGGGGFDNSAALSIIQQAGTSVALFAPAWTYEHFAPADFYQNELRFWMGKSIHDAMGRSFTGSIADFTVLRPVPASLPLYTHFDEGCGESTFVEGVPVGTTAWNNMCLQSLQPSYRNCCSNVTEFQMAPSYTRAWHGGSCLNIRGTILSKDTPAVVPLFLVNNVIGEPIDVSVRVQLFHGSDTSSSSSSNGGGISLGVQLTYADATTSVLLVVGDEDSYRQALGKLDTGSRVVAGRVETETQQSSDWMTFAWHDVAVPACELEEISLLLIPSSVTSSADRSHFDVNIGEFCLSSSRDAGEKRKSARAQVTALQLVSCHVQVNGYALHEEEITLQWAGIPSTEWYLCHYNGQYVGRSAVPQLTFHPPPQQQQQQQQQQQSHARIQLVRLDSYGQLMTVYDNQSSS